MNSLADRLTDRKHGWYWILVRFSCLLLVCVWMKLLLPPNIWFSPLEKLDEMSGFAFWPRHHVFIQGFTRPREKLAGDLLIKTLLIRTLKTFLTKEGSCKANSSPWSISYSKAKHTFFMTIKLIIKTCPPLKKHEDTWKGWYLAQNQFGSIIRGWWGGDGAFLQIPRMICFTRPFRELNLSVPAWGSFCPEQSTEVAIILPILTSQCHN